jgi:alpha-1,2-mannosyltransferase
MPHPTPHVGVVEDARADVGTSDRPPSRGEETGRWGVLVAAALLAVVLAGLKWVSPATWIFVDLHVFIRGADSVLSGRSLYASAPGTLAFTYPPFAALVFAPLGGLSVVTVQWLWTIVGIASLAVIVWISVRVSYPLLPRRRRLAWTAVLMVAGLALEPVQRTLVLGQINLILAVAVLVDVFVLPPRWKGVLIGIAAGIKLTPAFFALIFLLRRDWPSLTRSALGFVATAAAGAILLPSASLQYWSGGIVDLEKFGSYAVLPSNQSLRAALVRMKVPSHHIVLVLVPATACVLALSLFAAHRLLSRHEALAAVTCLGAGTVLISPISWTHHWVWVVPVMVVLAQRRWYAALAVLVAVMFLPPMWASDATEGLPVVHLVCTNAFLVLGLVYLGAMALVGTYPPAPAGAKST